MQRNGKRKLSRRKWSEIGPILGEEREGNYLFSFKYYMLVNYVLQWWRPSREAMPSRLWYIVYDLPKAIIRDYGTRSDSNSGRGIQIPLHWPIYHGPIEEFTQNVVLPWYEKSSSTIQPYSSIRITFFECDSSGMIRAYLPITLSFSWRNDCKVIRPFLIGPWKTCQSRFRLGGYSLTYYFLTIIKLP